MADRPTLKDIRAATLVDPKSKKPVSLEKYATHGDKIFESKKDAKASLEEDALAINDLTLIRGQTLAHAAAEGADQRARPLMQPDLMQQRRASLAGLRAGASI